MVVRFPRTVLLLLFLLVLSGCAGFTARKEAVTSPQQEITNDAVMEKEQARVQAMAFNNWCKYWLPFVSEYTGAVIEMETIGSQLAQKRTSTEIRTRIEEVSEKLKKAENYLGQLPPIDELSDEHRSILAQNAAKAGSILNSAKQIPAILFALAENPEDPKITQALAKKSAEANEIFSCHENVLRIRNAIIKKPKQPFAAQ